MTQEQQEDLAGLHLPTALNCLVSAINQIELGNTEQSKMFISAARSHIKTIQEHVLDLPNEWRCDP